LSNYFDLLFLIFIRLKAEDDNNDDDARLAANSL